MVESQNITLNISEDNYLWNSNAAPGTAHLSVLIYKFLYLSVDLFNEIMFKKRRRWFTTKNTKTSYDDEEKDVSCPSCASW